MRAYTLIELVIAIGLASALAGASLAISLAAYSHALGRSNQEITDAARSFGELQSLHGICRHAECDDAEAHGVRITSAGVKLFEGSTYADRIQALDTNLTFPITTERQPFTEIYFPSGEVSSFAP